MTNSQAALARRHSSLAYHVESTRAGFAEQLPALALLAQRSIAHLCCIAD